MPLSRVGDHQHQSRNTKLKVKVKMDAYNKIHFPNSGDQFAGRESSSPWFLGSTGGIYHKKKTESLSP